MSDIRLTTRTLRFLSIKMGDRHVEPRDGLIIPVTVNGDGPLLVSMVDTDEMTGKPHVEIINGVRYEVHWWLSRHGHHAYSADVWQDRIVRVQRSGSTLPSDRTPAARRLAGQLMHRIVEAVTNDPDVMREAELVAAERLVMSRQIEYDRALAELHRAETALRAAEATWDRLTDGDVLATVGPGEPTPAIAAEAERRSA